MLVTRPNETHPDDPVTTVMSWPVLTVDTGATIAQVVDELAAGEMGAVLVLRRNRLVGIVSERDVVAHLAAGADLSHLQAGEAMAGDLLTVDSRTTLLEAAAQMLAGQVRHLPVLELGGVAGMLSMRDLLAALLPVVAATDNEVCADQSGSGLR